MEKVLLTKRSFKFSPVTKPYITTLLKNIDIKKATGVDRIPPKLVKLSANILSEPLTKTINDSLTMGIFPDAAKIAAVSPVDKGTDNKNSISNFRPVSVLSVFSKIFEAVIKNQLALYLENIFSPFLSAYRENYSTQHVLIRLVEEWKKHLDNNEVVGGVLMDLSKAFDCIPHDLLIAKLSAYGVDKIALKYIYSYLKKRQQCVRINNIYSSFEEIISGVPQGSIVGPILFNAFLNDFFYDIENASVHNFADDNTLSCFAKTVKDLINVLKEESEVAINWFSSNKMIVNPDKFKSIIVTKNKSDDMPTVFSIDADIVSIERSVKLLGIHIGNRLNFNLHINNICKSTSNQLNSVVRLKKFLSFEQKKILVTSFILFNFDYCPLVWFILSAKSLRKLKIYRNVPSDFYRMAITALMKRCYTHLEKQL